MTAKQKDMSSKHIVMFTKKNVMPTLKKWFEIGRELLCSLLFPTRCPICDEILTPEEAEKGIHLACENKLYPVEGAVCMHCGRPLGQIESREHMRQKNGMRNVSGYDEVSLPIQSRFEDDSFVPKHLRIESAYEYCLECHRKGYVSAWNTDRKGSHLKTNQNASNITQGKSLYLYKGAIKKSMYRFKYANKREYARFFACQAVERYGTWLGVSVNKNKTVSDMTSVVSMKEPATNTRFDAIVPVPMYRPKRNQRGYNQAEAFAAELSKLTGIPVDKNCICRVKDTTPQKELNDTERKNNLENAFQKGKSIVQYSHILVVDDIYTTGYTAEAVAKELRTQGAHHIYLLSVCIGGNN